MPPPKMTARQLGLLAAACVCAAPALAGAKTPPPEKVVAPTFAQTLLPGSGGEGGGFVEPRLAVTPSGHYFATTSASGGGEQVVYRSTDGGRTWPRTVGRPTQYNATPDVEVVATRTGRLVTVELEGFGRAYALQTSFSDDAGRTWQAGSSVGSPADTDRPWLAVGPDDPVTRQPRVYLVWHNLASGLALHEIVVATSTDGGRTFGAPVPVTVPGDQAFLDLQCGDGYPSSIGVDQVTGQVHVAFGTRTSAAGGCGAQPVQFNIVTPTRVWVASSRDGSAGSWTQGLAVDRSGVPGVSFPAIFSPLALDRAGNAYLVYTESTTPDFVGAVRYVWSPPGARRWSKPVLVSAPVGGAVLPHVQAGDAGRVAFTWYASAKKSQSAPWFLMAAVTTDARLSAPSIAMRQVSTSVLLHGAAADLVGQCTSGSPASGLLNGVTCARAPDNYGTAVDSGGRLVVTYPGFGVPNKGTYVAIQRSGTLLFRR